SLGDLKRLNRIGGRTIAYYLITTAIAITIGLIVANFMQPGGELTDDLKTQLQTQFAESATAKVQSAKASEKSVFETLQGIVPSNILRSVSGPSPEMLALIFFAIMSGI